MSDSFDLLGSGGGGNPSFSFGPQGAQPGAYVQGTVLELAEVQQKNFDTGKLETWDNGDPKMQIRLTLQTQLRDPAILHDNGVRDVYLRGRKKPHDNGAKSTICAVLDAVREVTGTTQMQRGGTLTLQWISGMGFAGDPRNYQASYQPPALDLAGSDPALQTQQPVAAPAPVPVAAQGIVQAPPVVQQPVQQVAPQVVQAPPPVPAPPVAAQPVQNGPTPEQLAAVRAAGQDPAQVWPGYVEQAGQGVPAQP